MRLLSCENPQKVYNKYIDDYVYVPCGKCNICKNTRAAKYTSLLERERLQHRYSFFVTLTYSDEHLPVLSTAGYDDSNLRSDINTIFYPSRSHDCFCIPFTELFPREPDKFEAWSFYDIQFFLKFLRSPQYKGLPYASKTDVQLFLKRLNKYIRDNVTYKYKNFRYFIVSEYGSTTFRPHFHAIFYVDDDRLAERFADCVSTCWKYGINDTQPIENSACGYVAQYLNKHADLPYVYQNKFLSPFFLCSRNPFIGAFTQSLEVDKEIIMHGYTETFTRRKAYSIRYDNVQLQQSYQNRLFAKCPCFGTISDTLRVGFYTAYERYGFPVLKQFMNIILHKILAGVKSEFILYLRNRLSIDCSFGYKQVAQTYDAWTLFDEYSFNFLRRMYYVARKISRQACLLGISTLCYIRKIVQYYNNKEIYQLRKQYEYQEEISQYDVDSLALIYPMYIDKMGFTFKGFIYNINSVAALAQIDDAKYFAESNKKSHFKNAYLDSLKLKADGFMYNLIKSYLHGKKCYETLEAFAP